MSDNASHATTRSQSGLNGLITGVNALLTPQANVAMSRKSARSVTVQQDLGTVVRWAGASLQRAPHNVPASEHEWDDVTAFADSAADFNVFFVWEYEQDTTPNTDNVAAGTIAAEKNCLMEDHSGHGDIRTLAHETIHRLGIGPHSGTASHLISGSLGRTITKDQANTINPSGT